MAYVSGMRQGITMFFKRAFLWLLMFFVTGCATDKANFVTPEEFSLTRAIRAEARKLMAGDAVELAVEVDGNREVPLTELEVGYDGTIPVPLIGDVQIASMTLTEARDVLKRRYKGIYVSTPLVVLRMADRTVGEWGYATVLGQVRNPGRYPIASSAGITLSEALHEAGGFAPSANMNQIVVSRTTASGKLIQCICDITKLGRSGSEQRDLVLYNGDVVQVPERIF